MMRKKQHTPWMLIPTLRLIGFMVNCLNYVIQLRNSLSPLRSKPTTIRLLRPTTTTKLSELNSDEPVTAYGALNVPYLITHHNQHSLTLQVHDCDLNQTWIYRFNTMAEYTDCLRQYLDGATEYSRAPDIFMGPSTTRSTSSRRT